MNADSRKVYDALVAHEDRFRDGEARLGMYGVEGDDTNPSFRTTRLYVTTEDRNFRGHRFEIVLDGEIPIACVYRALIELESTHNLRRHNVSDEAIRCVIRHSRTPRELLMEQT